MRLKRNMVFNFRKLLTLRRGRSCAGPQIMFDIFFKEVGTFFVGRHKVGPCGRQTWLEAIISIRNLNYMVFSKQDKLLVCHLQRCSIFYARQHNFTHLGTIYILCASTRLLFYARQRNFMQGNFRHWQASTPIGVVLKPVNDYFP